MRTATDPLTPKAKPLPPWVPTAVALALAALFLAQAFSASLGESLTWDETGYIAAGYVNLRDGDYRLNVDHPPLMQKLTALPLLFMQIEAPDAGAPRFLESPNPRATYGREFFFTSGNDPLRITPWARAPVMLLGACLVLCVYGWGRELFGPGPALLSATLTALSPNLLAHGRLATEDMGCAALMFAATWMLWRVLAVPDRSRALLCGVVTGLALLAKYTSLLLAPIFAILVLASWRSHGSRAAARALAVSAGVALGVISLGYGLALRPDRYLAGIFHIYPDLAPGYAYYFWGEVKETPFRFYALGSLLLKTTPAALLLLALGVARAPRVGRALPTLFLLVPASVVIAVTFFDITAPGVRRVLAAVPFLLLFAGHAAVRAPRGVAIAVGLLLALSAIEAVRVFPHHLAYLNPAVGGTARAPYVLDESNIDWGQDLPALARWQRAHQRPDETLTLHYFGSAAPVAYGVVARRFDLRDVEQPPPGLYAISSHYLVHFRKLAALRGLDADWLTKYEPVAVAGSSLFIYRLPGPAAESGTKAPD